MEKMDLKECESLLFESLHSTLPHPVHFHGHIFNPVSQINPTTTITLNTTNNTQHIPPLNSIFQSLPRLDCINNKTPRSEVTPCPQPRQQITSPFVQLNQQYFVPHTNEKNHNAPVLQQHQHQSQPPPPPPPQQQQQHVQYKSSDFNPEIVLRELEAYYLLLPSNQFPVPLEKSCEWLEYQRTYIISLLHNPSSKFKEGVDFIQVAARSPSNRKCIKYFLRIHCLIELCKRRKNEKAMTVLKCYRDVLFRHNPEDLELYELSVVNDGVDPILMKWKSRGGNLNLDYNDVQILSSKIVDNKSPSSTPTPSNNNTNSNGNATKAPIDFMMSRFLSQNSLFNASTAAPASIAKGNLVVKPPSSRVLAPNPTSFAAPNKLLPPSFLNTVNPLFPPFFVQLQLPRTEQKAPEHVNSPNSTEQATIHLTPITDSEPSIQKQQTPNTSHPHQPKNVPLPNNIPVEFSQIPAETVKKTLSDLNMLNFNFNRDSNNNNNNNSGHNFTETQTPHHSPALLSLPSPFSTSLETSINTSTPQQIPPLSLSTPQPSSSCSQQHEQKSGITFEDFYSKTFPHPPQHLNTTQIHQIPANNLIDNTNAFRPIHFNMLSLPNLNGINQSLKRYNDNVNSDSPHAKIQRSS